MHEMVKAQFDFMENLYKFCDLNMKFYWIFLKNKCIIHIASITISFKVGRKIGLKYSECHYYYLNVAAHEMRTFYDYTLE